MSMLIATIPETSVISPSVENAVTARSLKFGLILRMKILIPLFLNKEEIEPANQERKTPLKR